MEDNLIVLTKYYWKNIYILILHLWFNFMYLYISGDMAQASVSEYKGDDCGK